MSDSLRDLSIAQAGRMLRAGEVTSRALTEFSLAQIASQDSSIDSFITVTGDRALADAQRADEELANGQDRGPMHGVPYALKDIYDTAGIRTTCHSKLRLDVVPEADSVCASKLASGGGVLLGKTATHEFAFGGPSFDLPFPPARNPWNRAHGPGGSSSGSGAAVASGFTRTALGSCTGGSIRGPAAYCGIVGLKPTYGRVSRRGVFPLAYTLDHCGPLSKTVEDAALTLQVIAGYDERDPASANVPVDDFNANLNTGVEGMRIGYLKSFFDDAPNVSAQVVQAVEAALKQLEDMGAIVEIAQDVSSSAIYNACGRILMLSEAFAIHETDLKQRPEDFGQLTRERIMLGAYLSSTDYVQALRTRRQLSVEVNRVLLNRYEVLVAPSSLTPAPLIDKPPSNLLDSPMQTMPFNVTGNPAMSLPIGFSAERLPLSMQIVGRYFDEANVIRVGQAYEQATDWHRSWPA
ncbi:MAG: aspartyl-tRNA(Asn)/glutamyl-tRNA(Gln) amidotransferase subunit A [Gammaproteobacteria bacterium]|jgi:aspartyl-tRNA(Asn)/glutamyl-tRNA(Gln) amidotransferase subunit A